MSGKNPLGNGREPQSYEGINILVPLGGWQFVRAKRDPTSNDKKYPLGTLWLNTVSQAVWMETAAPGVWTQFSLGGGFEYTTITADTQLANNTGYVVNKSGSLAMLTLPATASVGNTITILGINSELWLIVQNAGQTIHMNGASTTTGATGSLSSIDQYNTCELVCVVANTDWIVKSSSGILTII